MNRELFGVFGDLDDFGAIRDPDAFSEILDSDIVTVGIRDPEIGAPGWSSIHRTENGFCAIQGEAYPPDAVDRSTASWLWEKYDAVGNDAFSVLNGSYLAVLARGDTGVVVTDPVRSRECFYTDAPTIRVFGTDAAAVGSTIPTPDICADGLFEYLYLGVTLGEKTSLRQLDRLPMDSILLPRAVEPLERFVYEERTFDYAAELAERLERALDRRARLPGRKGLLLSAGYDSRMVLAGIPDIEQCYTIGGSDAQEVRGARRLAKQYGAKHCAFTPDRRYLDADPMKVRYSNGIKESLHIHHAGYTDHMEVDTMYHGLLCDTFFRGHFTALDGFDIAGCRIPRNRPDPTPDPVGTLLDKFGYDRGPSETLAAHTALADSHEAFVRRAVDDELQHAWERADSVHNALNACGIGNQPSMPFHNQLVDNFLSSFLAVDTELIDWHLSTPPEYRTTATFLEACERIDGDVIRHHPPDRPHDSLLLNEIQRFVRQRVPGLEAFDPPWPNRNAMFDRYDLDGKLLPRLDHLHDPLPARQKLRVHDILGWMDQAAPSVVEPTREMLSVHT